MAESWAATSVPQLETRATDTREMALLPQELNTSYPFTSDVICLQQKEMEHLCRGESVEEVEADLRSSWLSEMELTGMRAEFDPCASPILSLDESDLEPPEAVELLMCVEEPEVEDMMEGVPQTTFTPATPLPDSPDFISVPEKVLDVLHHLSCPHELPLFSKPDLLVAPTPESLASSKSECADQSSNPDSSVSPTEEDPLTNKPQPPDPTTCAELPVLLIGGAAIVAAVIIMKYAWTRK